MINQSPQERIAAFIKAKRRETQLGVRAAAKESGVSAATLSRLERGVSDALPDIGTLTKLANWLGVSISDLIITEERRNAKKQLASTTPEVVEVHLRADKNLPMATADALAKMFKVLYEQATQKKS